jgi:hypothetical protein
MLWTATYIVWSANAVLFVFAIDVASKPASSVGLILPAVFGLLLTWCVFHFAKGFRKLKNIKYVRCKEIERMLWMQQHTRLDGHPDAPKRGRQAFWYKVITWVFTLGWLALIVYHFLPVVRLEIQYGWYSMV